MYIYEVPWVLVEKDPKRHGYCLEFVENRVFQRDQTIASVLQDLENRTVGIGLELAPPPWSRRNLRLW